MGTNHHTAWAANVTPFTAAGMNPQLSDLDKSITYHKLALVGCDGTVSWATGTLTWSNTIHIYFTSAAGLAIHNSIAAGNIALSDSEFAYVTLSETPDAVLTMAKAAIGAGSASAFKAYNVLVMGYRNAADDGFYPEELAGVFAQALAGGAYVEKNTYDAQSILAATADNTPAALTVGEQTVVGRIAGGNVAALTMAQLRAALSNLDGRVYPITPANSITIDWTNGETQTLLLDRATTQITFANPTRLLRLKILSDGSTGRAITFTDTIYWRGGGTTPPAITAEENKWDWITVIWDGSVYSADIALKFSA